MGRLKRLNAPCDAQWERAPARECLTGFVACLVVSAWHAFGRGGSLPQEQSLRRAATHKTNEFRPYSPSLWCSSVEVVVYCSRVFSSGRSRATAPKAASVASWKPQRMSFFLPG